MKFNIIKNYDYSKYIDDLLLFNFLLYPQFKTYKSTDNNELIFLSNNDFLEDNKLVTVNNRISKTHIEATQNHYHIFYNYKKRDSIIVETISTAIAQNLKKVLQLEFPHKNFAVFYN